MSSTSSSSSSPSSSSFPSSLSFPATLLAPTPNPAAPFFKEDHEAFVEQNIKHLDDGRIECNACQRGPYKILRGLDEHCRLKHTGYKCHFCSWPGCTGLFASKSLLDTHYYTHAGTNKYPCHQVGCGEMCSTADALFLHTSIKQNAWRGGEVGGARKMTEEEAHQHMREVQRQRAEEAAHELQGLQQRLQEQRAFNASIVSLSPEEKMEKMEGRRARLDETWKQIDCGGPQSDADCERWLKFWNRAGSVFKAEQGSGKLEMELQPERLAMLEIRLGSGVLEAVQAQLKYGKSHLYLKCLSISAHDLPTTVLADLHDAYAVHNSFCVHKLRLARTYQLPMDSTFIKAFFAKAIEKGEITKEEIEQLGKPFFYLNLVVHLNSIFTGGGGDGFLTVAKDRFGAQPYVSIPQPDRLTHIMGMVAWLSVTHHHNIGRGRRRRKKGKSCHADLAAIATNMIASVHHQVTKHLQDGPNAWYTNLLGQDRRRGRVPIPLSHVATDGPPNAYHQHPLPPSHSLRPHHMPSADP